MMKIMRFWFLIFSIFVPHEQAFSSTAAHFDFSKMISVRTQLDVFKGQGFNTQGHYISFLSESGDLWFICLDFQTCQLQVGINQDQLALDSFEGRVKSTDISELKIKSQWAPLEASGFDQLKLLAHRSPAILNPNPTAIVKISQQNADVTLNIPDEGWTLEAQATEILGKSIWDDKSKPQNSGHASVQVNAGRLVIPEVLVSNQGHQ